MSQSNRYYNHTAYIAKHEPQMPRYEVLEPDNPSTIPVEMVMQHYEGATERTDNMNRSKALVVRVLPFSVIWLVLAIAIGMFASSSIVGMLTFAAMTGLTYTCMDRQEYQFSRNGLERHKVNMLTALKREEMHHTQELKRMALESYLKQLGDG